RNVNCRAARTSNIVSLGGVPIQIGGSTRTRPDQIHVRAVIAVYRVDVPPIAGRIFGFIAEGEGKNTSRIDERRNDMLSKIVTEPALAIFDQAPDENIGLEKVNAHADERSISPRRQWARIQRLLLKSRNPEGLVHFNNTKLRRVF